MWFYWVLTSYTFFHISYCKKIFSHAVVNINRQFDKEAVKTFYTFGMLGVVFKYSNDNINGFAFVCASFIDRLWQAIFAIYYHSICSRINKRMGISSSCKFFVGWWSVLYPNTIAYCINCLLHIAILLPIAIAHCIIALFDNYIFSTKCWR